MPNVIIIEKKGRETKCDRCNHKWYYTGNTLYACSCPKCGTSVIIHKRKKKKNEKINQEEIEGSFEQSSIYI